MLSDNLDLETGSICWPGKRCHSRDLQLFQYPFLKQLREHWWIIEQNFFTTSTMFTLIRRLKALSIPFTVLKFTDLALLI